MKIAVLALGSLAADPALQLDGPLLPIEFAEISPRRELILVLCNWSWVLYVQTLWVESMLNDLNLARQDLAAREGVDDDEIGYIMMNEESTHPEHLHPPHNVTLRDVIRDRLRPWGQDHGFDAVIWRDSPANVAFLQVQPEPTLHQVQTWVDTHLQGLPKNAPAATYIKRVPIQIWTPIRAHIVRQLGWLPGPADVTITDADDLRLKDWQECRTTIGRLDGYLEDLRKYGFSLITGLLTAGAFLGFVPAANSAVTPNLSAGVFIAIMVLVAALYSVDTYYQVLLSGAVERALDIEAQTVPPIRVTKYLSVNATNSGVSYITLFLYLVLLVTAGGLGLLAAKGLNLGLIWSSKGLNLGPWSTAALVWVVVFGVLLVGIILIHWLWPNRLDWLPLVMGGVLGIWFTVGLGLLLLESAVATSPGVSPWVVGIGMFLAVYIEVYWVYVARQSGLHREKRSRIWPEGKGKVATP